MLKLSDVVSAFSKISEDAEVYLNKNSGKSIVLYDNAKNAMSVYNELDSNLDAYVLLPNCNAIDVKSIMARFINEINNENIKDDLVKILNQPHPCTLFMDSLFHLGLRDMWSDFKYKEMIDLSIKYLNFYQLDFEDDITVPKNTFVIEVTRTIKKEYKIKANTKEDALSELDSLFKNEDLNTYTTVRLEEKIK